MNKKRIIMIAKYLLCLVLPFCAVVFQNASKSYLAVAFLEILIIAIFTNILCGYKKVIGYIFNIVLLALFNIQYGVLFWANSYITLVMLNNIDSAQGIGGNIVEYALTVLAVGAVTALPVCHIPIKKMEKIKKVVLSGTCLILLFTCILCSDLFNSSPFYGYYSLVQQYQLRKQTQDIIAEQAGAGQDGNGDLSAGTFKKFYKSEFYKEEVADYIKKPDSITEKPNVILLFVEGFSQNIIEDPRTVTPNIQALQEQSLRFENYYNHTFATFMALSGQLYSGYQQDNYDPNYLVSLQDIFKQYGYQTTFINTEPTYKIFTDYLSQFDFDTLINKPEMVQGENPGLTDKEAIELMLDTALEQAEKDEPFFLSMYTYGTHVTFDSPDEKFNNGSDQLLNRFYNLDAQIGKFIQEFNNSSLAEDTIFILTADHATYQDADFIRSYPDYDRTSPSVDRIPFLIYYKGMEPACYDVGGRNSLDLTPTILDYLDMTGENSFLGESLFSPLENDTMFDTWYESMGSYYTTENGKAESVTADKLQDISQQIAKYFFVKLQKVEE